MTNQLQCNNCNSFNVSQPFCADIVDSDSNYRDTEMLVKCFDCGFISTVGEFAE